MLERDEPFHILWSPTQGATREHTHTLLSARILTTPDYTMCLDYTLSERKVIVYIKKTDEAHSRTESPEGQEEEEERTQTGGEVGGPGSSLKSYVCIRSLPG